MLKNENHKNSEQIGNQNKCLTEQTEYDFDKNSFIVEPVFKKDNSETLGSVLLRLMTQK